jgi:hypothetical protein
MPDSGLGWKEFNANEVLTASDLMGYLMNQSVLVFADAAAYTASSFDPSNGAIRYIVDTGSLEFYDGSDWVRVALQSEIGGFVTDTKGDLATFDPTVGAGEVVALAVGTNGRVLIADSSVGPGIKWGQITVDGIADDAVTVDKILNGTNGYFLSSTASAVAWAEAVTPTGTQTLTNKTLTSPTINGATIATSTINQSALSRAIEQWTYSTSSPSGTLTLDLTSSTAYFYYPGTAVTTTWTPTFTNISTLLNADGKAVTVAVIVRVGSQNGYSSSISITGASSTSLIWQGGITPGTSNTSAGVDAYTYTIVRTAENTYTVFASRTRFA